MTDVTIYTNTTTSIDFSIISEVPANHLTIIRQGVENVKAECHKLNTWIQSNTKQRSAEREAIYAYLDHVLNIKRSTFKVYASLGNSESLIKTNDSLENDPKSRNQKKPSSKERIAALEAENTLLKERIAKLESDSNESAKDELITELVDEVATLKESLSKIPEYKSAISKQNDIINRLKHKLDQIKRAINNQDQDLLEELLHVL